MAKQKGYIKLRGSLGGLTFYEKDGEDIVRTTGGVTKSRIETDPAYVRTRENMQEFGGAATIGKSFRQGFANVVKTMSGFNLTGRVTAVMKRIITKGAGPRGERYFEVIGNKELIEGFEFNLEKTLGSVFYPPYSAPTLNANRDISTWTVPDFSTDSFINPPEGATHFMLVLATGLLSDFNFNTTDKKYEPLTPSENGLGMVAYTPQLPLGGMVGASTVLTNDFGIGAALPSSIGVINGVGIIFFQEVNAQFYELASDNTMHIAMVG